MPKSEGDNVIKALQGTVVIGDITIHGYQLPDGSYRLSGRNVTDAVGELPASLAREMEVSSLKELPGADKFGQKIETDVGAPFIPVSLEDAFVYWVHVAHDNPKAMALVVALGSETLERRFDRVFGVERTEEERDERLNLRYKRVSAFFKWTDCIKVSQEERGIYRTDLGNREFGDLIRMVNRRLFGQSHYNCDRDTMSLDQQLDITAFERMMSRRYKPGADIRVVIYECLDFYQNTEH